mmetsp:Transcript_33742/g.38854  ORF Transcript_33742/g.38854 Transcript_33742/m.38854 type:complete len:112 (-) Transcript_33742:255-590(-)
MKQKTISAPMTDLNVKKIKSSKTKNKKEDWGTRSQSKISQDISENVHKIKEFKEQDEESDTIAEKRVYRDTIIRNGSVMDPDQDDFIERVEQELTNRNTKDNTPLEDSNGK